jgi:DNA polymerase-3 subunit gamma/tau
MALALYRKYRPQKLEDLLGQETAVTVLKNAARENKLGHAYLFYGPRGTGKTTAARIVAKLLTCETRQSDPKFHAKGEPCTVCGPCREIAEGTYLDLIEIDAASNRGIDEIRDLKEGIRVSPSRGKWKIYIVDEAHMLTREAANALLKTLEEPPPHAVLVLATTEYEKIPATIASRSQRFLFKKLPKTVIMQKLSAIAKQEEIAIEPQAVELIAAAGDGSVRDAESLLDQVVSLAGASHNPITLADVEHLTGRTALRKIHELADWLFSRNLEKALALIHSLQEEGYNLVDFTKDLIHYLRKVLVYRMSPALKPYLLTELTADELAAAGVLAQKTDPEIQTQLLKRLIVSYQEMRYSPFPLVPLEIAIVEHLEDK